MGWIELILLSLSLAMDCFAISCVVGMLQPELARKYVLRFSLAFGVFQGGMPLLGWLFVHLLVERFTVLEKFTPWVALGLLLYIGIGMIIDAVKNKDGEEDEGAQSFGIGKLLVMGVATSIDALSVGVTIAELPWQMALVEAVVIGIVTWAICLLGIRLGAAFGTKFKKQAGMIGGIILIGIGLEIFIKGVFF